MKAEPTQGSETLRRSRAQASGHQVGCRCAQGHTWFVPRPGESSCGHREIEISAVDLHAIRCLNSHGAGGVETQEHADEKAVERRSGSLGAESHRLQTEPRNRTEDRKDETPPVVAE